MRGNKDEIGNRAIDLTWDLIGGTTWEANLSNSSRVKLVKLLNNASLVGHIATMRS
jgi:hypothetical protein